MAKARKKPVEVDYLRFRGDNAEEVRQWAMSLSDCWDHEQWVFSSERVILIPTLEGTMTAIAGDYIIRGIKGEFYPCKADIFIATYDFV